MSKIFAVLLLSFLNGAVRGESPATPVELPVLPSSYGYYALDQGGLTPLFERTLGNTKEEKQARQHFSSDVSVVVFQKWLSEPNASLNTIDVFDWRTMDDEPRPKVPRQISPVKGHPDMAVVSMPGGFKPGIYSVNHDKREYAIGVGLDNLEGWWKDVLKENPKRWHAHEYLGAFCFMRSDLDGALEYWKHCVELKPDLYETHNNYALALSAKGRKDDALKEYEIAVKLDGHQLAVRINYADALRGGEKI